MRSGTASKESNMSKFAEGYINVTGLNVRAFATAAFDLSPPPRLAHLGLAPRQISPDVLDQILADFDEGAQEGILLALRLDYVEGRGCKISIWREHDGQLYIRDTWYDHDEDDLTALLARALTSASASVA
jgi:hypothetical protein